MSGGFFRGTTADQDTRFSNKQAKLLKSQKFAPELEHMVDVSKVKMDVIKPWIAKRVTEFLGGFEDEVLINFIYGLLEGKEINGKAIQIQLTGFMEKNTGKFMKELWGLLISAQKNASGVPQQFLDAKEEETKKKKAETDRITSEIQKRKDREAEEEKTRKTDGVRDNSSSEESNRRRGRGFDSHSGDENGVDVQNGSKGRNRSPRLPHPSNRSPSPRRGRRSMSPSKSFSNSRSYSKERSISKSISPRPRKYSISPVNARRTPPKSASPRKQIARESISPRRRPYSRRSPSPMRRRFHSPLRRRSPSPYRRRRSPPRRRRSPSPWRRRSPSPRRRRSPSPVRQRRRRSTSSPRSRSPVQRRSPYAGGRRYPTPRRRSPYTVRRVSPSPDRRVSQSPRRRRSPSPRRHRSPSPVRRRSPYVVRRSPVRVRRRSPTRSLSRSVSPANRRSVSPARDSSASPTNMKSPGERTRLNDHVEPASMARRQSMAMSPQRDHSGISRSRRKVPSVSPSPPPEKSPSYEDSPKQKTRSSGDNTRLASSFGSSQKTKSAEDKMIRDGSRSPPPEMKGRKVRRSSPHNNSEELKNSRKGEQIEHKSTERGYDRSYGAKKQEAHDKPASLRDIADVGQKNSKMTGLEVPPEEAHALKRSPHKDFVSRAKGVTSYPADATKLDGKLSSVSKYSGDDRPDVLVNTRKKQRSPSVSSDSESEGSEKHKAEVAEKRKHKRHSRREAVSDDTSSESEIEDRKEAKRRKKEEKKSRKEERRRRRDERRRRKEEKRASRRKRKSRDADDLSLDMKENEKVDKPSNGERVAVKYSSDEETESQKKKLEIELREKALESLRAKRGIRH